MYVKTSSSKVLKNNLTTIRKIKKKQTASSLRCNHCGGPVRANGEINSCLMCSREASHVCTNCSNLRPEKVVAESKKISA